MWTCPNCGVATDKNIFVDGQSELVFSFSWLYIHVSVDEKYGGVDLEHVGREEHMTEIRHCVSDRGSDFQNGAIIYMYHKDHEESLIEYMSGQLFEFVVSSDLGAYKNGLFSVQPEICL
jgi:hypothetical protein